jgi:hypothetical protein
MKKFKLKSMGPKQILAYLVFLIAVVWTLKFIFELTSSGVKQVSKEISKSSGLPILECVFNNPDGTKNKTVYDLDDYAKRVARGDDSVTFNDITLDNQYLFSNIYPQGNGMIKSISIILNKKTGAAELTITIPYKINADFGAVLDAFSKGDAYLGICNKIKDKKL